MPHRFDCLAKYIDAEELSRYTTLFFEKNMNEEFWQLFWKFEAIAFEHRDEMLIHHPNYLFTAFE